MTSAPRPAEQRKAETLTTLQQEVDLWVASADAAGGAYLVPLSFYWDGQTITIATPRTNRTARNLLRAGWARVGIGHTRDVVIVEGPLEERATGADPAAEDAHARATGFDPREEPEDYAYLVIAPRTILAWREANELAGRRLMRDGEWLV